MDQKPVKVTKYYVLLVLATVAYLFLSLTAKPTASPATAHLARESLIALQLTFVIPIAMIWWAGVYGAASFKRYAANIKGSADGDAMNRIANGLLWLIFGTIFTSLLNTILTRYFAGDSASIRVIMNNYLVILLPLIAYFQMQAGAKELVSLVKVKDNFKSKMKIASVALAVLSAAYLYVTFTNPNRNMPAAGTTSSFYLPDILILLTLSIPYIVSWYLGIRAAVGIGVFRQTVKGKIYKEALASLVRGIYAIVGFAISLQLLQIIGPALRGASLGLILVIIYPIIALYGLCYLFVASGAKKLSKIEAVQ